MRTQLILTLSATGLIAGIAGANEPQFTSQGQGSNIAVSNDGNVLLTNDFFLGAQLQPVGGAPVTIGNGALGTNGLGNAAAGTLSNEAALWAIDAGAGGVPGWLQLGGITGGGPCGSSVSTGYDVAGDGTVAGSTVVGLAWDGCQARGFKWTQASGMLELPQSGPNSSRASTISEDGNVVGGWDEAANGSRRAAIWDAAMTQTLLLVSAANPDGAGEVLYLNDDGSVAVGNELSEPYRWKSGVVTSIPRPAAGMGQGNNYFATGCTDDGRVVVGGADPFFGTPVAWIWTEWGGTQSIDELLTQYGVTGYNPADLGVARGISADGRIIVGDNGVPFGSTRWYIQLPSPLTETYCTAGTSASGCQALINFQGTPSATAAVGFKVAVLGLEGAKDGLFFFGANGRQANAWGTSSSYQCVVPPVSRSGLQIGNGTNGACNGFALDDLNTRWTLKPGQNPGAGALIQVQYWYRDPLNTSNRTTSLSNALEAQVCP